MAWEQRGSKRYYYRSVRDGTRVRKEYFGAGPLAATLTAEEAAERAARCAEGEAWRQARAELEALDQQVATWWDLGTLVLNATLYGEGLYQHDRGAWRRRAPTRDEGNRAAAPESLEG